MKGIKTKKNRLRSRRPYRLNSHTQPTYSENKINIITPYAVAIPTYKRPELIAKCTLLVLYRAKIPAANISLFLANSQERNTYVTLLQNPINSEVKLATLLPKHMDSKNITRYAKWLQGINIVVGHKGLARQRNFIRSWYPSGQNILSMDDDVRKVMRLRVSPANPKDRSKWKLIAVVKGLDELIQSGFRKAKDKGAYLWGVYPVDNAYFMSPNSSYNLKFIVGPMYGIINRPELANHLDLDAQYDEKEDMERTLRHWKHDGIVVRLNYVTIQTNYFDNIGGMQASLNSPFKHRKAAAEKAALRLHNMFPNITRIYKRTGGPRKDWAEIRLVGTRSPKHTHKNPSSYVAQNSFKLPSTVAPINKHKRDKT